MRPMLPDPRPYFADLPDPHRETRNKLHPLNDIVMIVLCAVLSGVVDWVGMADFAEEKEAWLRGFLDLANGIPSRDTLKRRAGTARTGGVRGGHHRLGDGGPAEVGGRAGLPGWENVVGQSGQDDPGGPPDECVCRAGAVGAGAAGGGGEVE